MKRLLCITALSAVVLVPDWAAACWPFWGTPAYHQPYCAPAYAPPVYYFPPAPAYCEPVYVAPCVPAQAPVLPPPQVQRVKPSSGNAPAKPPAAPPAARPEPAPPSARANPQPDPVHPAGGELKPAKPAGPEVKAEPVWEPAAPKSEPKAEPKRGGLFEIPKNMGAAKPKADEPTPAKVEAPKPAEQPKGTAEPKLPPLELPKESDPKLPSLGVPGASAVPVPAPAADALIPPAGVPGPTGGDALPPLALPPETPVAPAKATEAKSSPLAAGGVKVSVFPATGAAAGPLRKVGFYNHTKRDLALTIEGRAVTLPAKSYLFAHLPPSFSWTCAGKPAATQTVPADAAGLDVLIRE
jgi:hypothetical protein